MQRKLRFVCGKGMRALRIGVTASRTSEDPNVHRVTKNMTKAMAATGEEMVTLDWPLNTEEMEKVLPTLDGVIIAGGPDMHPKYYGQEIDPYCGEINEERDELEIYVIGYAMEHDLPMLGVCRGMQVINAALGGTLHQDVVHHLGIRHRQPEGMLYYHDIIFEGDSLLRRLVGSERYPVNSFHHQAVDRLADGLVATGYNADGLIEAYERPGSRFLMGVQWHPEVSYFNDSFSRKIFSAFLAACAEQK